MIIHPVMLYPALMLCPMKYDLTILKHGNFYNLPICFVVRVASVDIHFFFFFANHIDRYILSSNIFRSYVLTH